MTAVRVAAHAKVNLFLRVLAREADGFHGIETLFSLLELHDLLTVERVEGRGATSGLRNQRNHSTPLRCPAVDSQFGSPGSRAAIAIVHEPSGS